MKSVYPVAFNDILVIALAVVSVALLTAEFTYDLSAGQWRLLQGVDIAIALTFLGEFVYRLMRAPRAGTFLVYNWWQLLAAIPVTTLPTQTLRALMLLRAAHILRFTGIGARLLVPLTPFLSFIYHTRVTAIVSVFAFVFLLGTSVFHVAEVEMNGDIESYWDTALFAAGAVTTTELTTVPQTLIGEIVTFALMFSGITTLGVFTAYVASYLVRRREQ